MFQRIRSSFLLWLSAGLVVFLPVFAAAGPAPYQPAPQTPVAEWLSAVPEGYPADHPPVHWRFAHPAPPASLLPPVWQAGWDQLGKATGARFQVEMLGGGLLYGITGGFKAMRAGIAEMGTCYTGFEAKGFELTKTFQLPYVAPENPFLTARILTELAPRFLRQEFEKRGVYPGQFVPSRPLALMSKTPIYTPDDLKGKKVVSFINTPEAASHLGYTEVRIPFPEIYTAMQQGIVDAVIWVDMGFIPFRIYEQAKYYTDINVAPVTIETCFHRKSFDRLPRELKQVVYDAQQKIAIAVVEQMERFAAQASTIYEAQGVKQIKLSVAQRDAWVAAFAPVTEQWLTQCEEAGKPCRALVKEINQLADKYRQLSNAELMELAIKQPVPGIIPF